LQSAGGYETNLSIGGHKPPHTREQAMTLEHELLTIMMALGIIADLSDWYACGDQLI
jgi:hypothetical protein